MFQTKQSIVNICQLYRGLFSCDDVVYSAPFFRGFIDDSFGSVSVPSGDDAVKKVKELGNQAKQKAKDAYFAVRQGNTSIRWIALITGVGLVLDSFYGFFIYFFHGNFVFSILNFYAFVMGASAVVMESDVDAIPYAEQIRFFLGKYVGAVRTVIGRGTFYGIAATMELALPGRRSKFLGILMLVVATAYIYIGSKSAAKIRALRTKAYPKETIKDKFNSFDTNKSGSLSFKEFYNLLNSLDVDIDYRDAEMIFVRVDKSLGDGISFEEFIAFWSDSDEIP